MSRAADLLLRLSVAFAFLFPPLNAFVDPYSWIGYFPHFLHSIVPDMVMLHAFGLIEVVLALWVLSGRRIFVPSLICAGLLLIIVVFNLSDFSVLFRDVSIALAALALAAAHRPARVA